MERVTFKMKSNWEKEDVIQRQSSLAVGRVKEGALRRK